ncbi:MAG: DUF3427 domain-containing protein [Deltaproteobacteria bacterium]|nr:DUF3427 domain-containing protein [Deltaproteobacteria bacterium]
MTQRQRGLYELLVTERLEQELTQLDERLRAERDELRPAEAPDRISLHVQRILRQVLADLPDDGRVEASIALARTMLDLVGRHRPASRADDERPAAAAKPLLRAIVGRLPDGTLEHIPPPATPLLDTTLLTNAPGEPRVGQQILGELASADRVDLVMAFIRRSGLRPMRDALRRHCEAGRPLRVLTTTYTNSTEQGALDELVALGAKIQVSYDQGSTRLHAKAWIFHRDSGFSTAFVGSSNLTHSAQVTGLEWNVRVSGARNPDVLEKIAAVFEGYWHGGDFVPYDPTEFAVRAAQSTGPSTFVLSPIELRLHPFQERLLEQIALSLARGHTRNLLVAATGTGKTVMAAVHYLRRRAQLPRARLLFVAHRKELLEQARATFRHAVRDASFGELWVDGHRPKEFQHVFASMQSLSASGLEDLPPKHFDVVILDEFHHAAAHSYRALLEHVEPCELLGLTATPERSDGLDVLHYFGGRIAAELRLWDAIDQHRLAPFVYYGVHDGLDLTSVTWRRGRGYDVEGLTNLMTADDLWARRVLAAVHHRVDDVAHMRALGFCVSVEHARFMARVFQAAGLSAVAIWGDSPAETRAAALQALREGAVQVLFSVDLFNEGVDVPDVDTLLLLRPTESATLFLQQLGRGLRKTQAKPCCTVLDFVGLHRREFRFDQRLRALLGGTRRQIERQVDDGFPFLPAGCHMELDRVAKEVVLRNLRESLPTGWRARVEELRAFASRGLDPTLRSFLEETGLELEDVYATESSWSDLREAADCAVASCGPDEAALRRGIGRLLHVDDRERIAVWTDLLGAPLPAQLSLLPERARRLARMLLAQLGSQVFRKDTDLGEAWMRLWAHPQLRAELVELLAVLTDRVDHVQTTLLRHPNVPLQVHARYTRIEILAAFGDGANAKIAAWQTGVRWLPAARADLLAFTLDKTSGSFSPTTRYRDYAISPVLIHWESQGSTRADSDTGGRYQRHQSLGSEVMLFARLHDRDRAFWFLGPASYVSHRGDKPMAITWRLEHPLPGDLYAQFAAAVA